MSKNSLPSCKAQGANHVCTIGGSTWFEVAKQQWSTVLHPISEAEVKQTGEDLTLVVVYGSGPAQGLSRYFSNLKGGAAPGTTMLDPKDEERVAKYKRDRERF